MPGAWFAFHPDLWALLPHAQRREVFWLTFQRHQSLKHLIESLGVPHTEIGEVRRNGQAVEVTGIPTEGDRIEVFPAPPQALPIPPRFVLDNHLGRLAAYLRMLGYDSLYRNDFEDEELAQIAVQQERVLLTRDRRLLMRRGIRFGHWVRSQYPREQVAEVVRRFCLNHRQGAFQRCLRCNTPLEAVSKESVLDQLEPLTRLYYDEFHRCPSCGQVYWKGSHYERMLDLIERLPDV